MQLAPDFITCTYGAGGSTRDKTLDVVAQVKQRFAIPVASHLTCVGATVEQLCAYLTEADRHGTDYIVALRGDPPRGQSEVTPDRRRPGLRQRAGGADPPAVSPLRDRGRRLSRNPPGGDQPRGRPGLPQAEGRGGGGRGNHPAVLRQRRFLRLPRPLPAEWDRGTPGARHHADHQSETDRADRLTVRGAAAGSTSPPGSPSATIPSGTSRWGWSLPPARCKS